MGKAKPRKGKKRAKSESPSISLAQLVKVGKPHADPDVLRGLWLLLAGKDRRVRVHDLRLYLVLTTSKSHKTLLYEWASLFDTGRKGLDAETVEHMFVAAALTKLRCDYALPGTLAAPSGGDQKKKRGKKLHPLRFALAVSDAVPFQTAAAKFFAKATKKTASANHIALVEFAKMHKAKELGPILAYFESISNALPVYSNYSSGPLSTRSSGDGDNEYGTSVFVSEFHRPRGTRFRRGGYESTNNALSSDFEDSADGGTGVYMYDDVYGSEDGDELARRSQIRSRARQFLTSSSKGSTRRGEERRRPRSKVRVANEDATEIFEVQHWADDADDTGEEESYESTY